MTSKTYSRSRQRSDAVAESAEHGKRSAGELPPSTPPVRELFRHRFALRDHAAPDDVVLRDMGFAHIAVCPVDKNIVVATAIVVLALAGAKLQDAKKERLQPHPWPVWERRTSFIPFATVIGGRAERGSLGSFATISGTLLWPGATWAHLPLAGWAAGISRRI